MSLTSFLLKDSNQIIYYDSETHSLYNQSKELLSLPPPRDESWYKSIADTYGVTHKSESPKIIRILLGQACNYSCGYCMQKDIGNLHEKPESFHLETFMTSVKDNLDLSLIERVELWGGEPFLYWNDIVPLMKMFDRENLSFFISTNGSPLVQKHVDFFKTLKARVEMAISHDGPGQEALRGEDILKRPKKVDILKQLYQLAPKVSFSFNSVLSATNYDLLAINKYFKEFVDNNDIPNTKLTFILIRNYDDKNSENSAQHVINGKKLTDFGTRLGEYLDKYILDMKEGKNNFLRSNIVDGPLGLFDYARNLKTQIPITATSRCGADCSNILSLDVKGNAKLCPHTHEKFDAGKLNNIKGIRVTRLDLDRKNEHCYHCPVKRLCKSSCPIKLPDEVFLMNCAAEKVFYGVRQLKAFELIFNEKVELLETGL